MSGAGGVPERGQRPRAWATPREVPDGSGVGTQVRHMRLFADGAESGPVFAKGWLSGRRSALDAGERTRASFERILDDVFYILEEYVIDPELRDAGDMTDEALRERVRAAVLRLEEL